ncbi:MAG TPA: pantetheine-phosphate adenylyltransferase [Salinivirgaceae bacterium]|nr:pantetheine-phosphate adenylyltransferase [Salinivirgaceae bacterium]
MSKIAVFPGSFDPITLGHESVVLRAVELFDKIIVAVGHNLGKTGFFTVEERVEMVKKTFENVKKVEVAVYEGLTVKFCKDVNAKYILRGLRTSSDFEFEQGIAQMNKKMYPELETVFILSVPELMPVSSTIVRDIYRNNGDISIFVPEAIVPLIQNKLRQKNN